jgi:hypothetical protein
VGLPEALERAAEALPGDADSIRPANGDPIQLRELLDAQAATRVLGWLLVNEPADGGELAREWAEDPEAAVLVLGVDESSLPKAGRKALRRVRHQLRSRGVEVPEEKREDLVAKLPALEERLDEALLSPIDPRGSRVAFLVTSHPAGGARMFEVLLDDARGIVETRVYNAGRSQVRRFTRSFSQRDEFPAVSAEPDSVRALVKRIAASHPADRPLPRGFAEWRVQVAEAPEGTATPGEIARAALGEVDAEPSLLRQAAELVRAGKVGPWPPPSEALHALAEQLGEAAHGQVVLSGAQRRERLDGILEEALEGLFAEPFAVVTATRFEEMAYWFWKRESEDDARVCLAAARAFRETHPRENSVARTMIEVVLAPVMAKLEEETNQPESGGEEK